MAKLRPLHLWLAMLHLCILWWGQPRLNTEELPLIPPLFQSTTKRADLDYWKAIHLNQAILFFTGLPKTFTFQHRAQPWLFDYLSPRRRIHQRLIGLGNFAQWLPIVHLKDGSKARSVTETLHKCRGLVGDSSSLVWMTLCPLVPFFQITQIWLDWHVVYPTFHHIMNL